MFRYRCATLLLCSALVSPAFAQTAATSGPASTPQPAPATGTTAEVAGTAAGNNDSEIIVTGTLFRRPNTESVSPITTLTTQNLRAAGITTVADAVRSISADNSGSIPTAFGNGFAAGASGVALRGLTVNSTLVLIDGLRTANYALADDGQRGFVDINTIPESLIDRIDVFKDGASSLYGADAIGGVVNIVLKQTFKGVEANAEGGTSQHGGGNYYNVSATAGWGDIGKDGYNVYINAEYQHDSQISVGSRGFPFNTNDLSSIGGNNQIGGQPALFAGSIYGTVTPGTLANPTDVTTGIANSGALAQVLRPGGCGPLSRTVTDPAQGTYCAQNLTSYGVDQPEQTRYGVSGRLTKDLGGDWRGYVSVSYYENRVNVPLAPSQIQNGTPNNTNSIALPVTLSNGQLNPNNPFAAQGNVALINYAFGDIPRSGVEQNHVWRGVLDARGKVAGFNVDVSGVVAHTDLRTTNSGYINYNQLISDVNSGAYNFIDPSQNSAAVRNALSPALTKNSTTDLDMVQVTATRGIYDLPGGPLNFGFGGSFRYEATYDPNINPGNIAEGLGVAQTIGHHNVASGYFEIDAPVFRWIDVDVSGRYDHYSDAGDNFSPKVGVKLRPIRQIELRGTYSEGFRAPSFSENGNSAAEGFITYTLPPDFAALHGNNGYTQPYSLALLTAANPNVKPETSRNFTVGTVLQPTRWLTISADYYNIKKDGLITQSNPFAVLNAYFAGQPLPPNSRVTADVADPQFPNALARPLVVAAPYVNANSLLTDGVDLDALVNFRVHDFKITSEVEATGIFRYQVNNGGTVLDYVGSQSPYNTSSGAGTPQWRGRWQTTVEKGPASVSATAYYVSAIRLSALDISGNGCFSTNAVTNASVPQSCRQNEFIDVDVTGNYKLTPKLDVFVNVLNVFDAKPPLDPINYAGINYNPTYSQAGIIGRFFKVGLHYRY